MCDLFPVVCASCAARSSSQCLSELKFAHLEQLSSTMVCTHVHLKYLAEVCQQDIIITQTFQLGPCIEVLTAPRVLAFAW